MKLPPPARARSRTAPARSRSGCGLDSPIWRVLSVMMRASTERQGVVVRSGGVLEAARSHGPAVAANPGTEPVGSLARGEPLGRVPCTDEGGLVRPLAIRRRGAPEECIAIAGVGGSLGWPSWRDLLPQVIDDVTQRSALPRPGSRITGSSSAAVNSQRPFAHSQSIGRLACRQQKPNRFSAWPRQDAHGRSRLGLRGGGSGEEWSKS